MDFLKANTAAVKALCGHGLTAVTANEIVYQMASLQQDEWTRTLERVASGEAKHVRVFVAWDDDRHFRTFLYSGDKDSTVAAMLRTWGEVTRVDNINVGAWGDSDVEADGVRVDLGETEVVPVACFDIGKGLGDALHRDTAGV